VSKLATLKDVAREAGVSVTTVSYTLQGNKKISDETAKKVKEVAKRLNYRPSGLARSLQSQKTWNIGVFLHGYAGPIYGDILQAIHDGVSGSGYEIMVCSTSVSDRLLVEKHMDGAIILNSFLPAKLLKSLQSAIYPIVVMDRVLDLPHVTSVVPDNEMGGILAVKHLLSTGCKRPGFIIGSKESNENNARVNGVKKALYEAGIDYEMVPVTIGGFRENTGKIAMSALLEEYPDIDSVFCLNDEMALGAIAAIVESGRSIPKDIAVVGFDDIPTASYSRPSLTTVRVDRRLWGYLASTHLLKMIMHEESRQIVKIPLELIKRQSTGKVNMGFD